MTFQIMQWATRDCETGTIIDLFATEEEALEAIKAYKDKGRYEIAQLNHEE